MELKLVTDRDEALALAGLVQRCAEASTAEFRDAALPEDVGRRAIERGFDQPEFLLAVAREDGAPDGIAGLCLVMPFVDPLTAERLPMIVLLHVERSHRHRGVARALVSEAQRLLSRRGLGALAARAGHNDDALISMGERWGFLRAWELLVREQ